MQSTSTMVRREGEEDGKSEPREKKGEKERKGQWKKLKKNSSRSRRHSSLPRPQPRRRRPSLSPSLLFHSPARSTLRDAPQARCPRGRHLCDLHDGQGEQIGPKSPRMPSRPRPRKAMPNCRKPPRPLWRGVTSRRPSQLPLLPVLPPPPRRRRPCSAPPPPRSGSTPASTGGSSSSRPGSRRRCGRRWRCAGTSGTAPRRGSAWRCRGSTGCVFFFVCFSSLSLFLTTLAFFSLFSSLAPLIVSSC